MSKFKIFISSIFFVFLIISTSEAYNPFLAQVDELYNVSQYVKHEDYFRAAKHLNKDKTNEINSMSSFIEYSKLANNHINNDNIGGLIGTIKIMSMIWE